MEYTHKGVMLKEVLSFLRPKRGGYFIDCTLGGGGYTTALAEAVGDSGRVLGIDLDEEAISNTAKKNFRNITLVRDNFRNLQEIVRLNSEPGTLFDGVVLDLGLSSAQLDNPERGFSFRQEAPLDMSFEGRGAENSTGKIVNGYGQKELEKIIRDYGEERFAAKIARAIVQLRRQEPIKTTAQLADIIRKAVPKRVWGGKIDPSTRTFQALRIETNRELESLKEVLPAAAKVLKKGGRLAVVSFHSLEDRIVKDFFRTESRDCLCPPALPACRCGHRQTLKIITKKIVLPSVSEIADNPRSRSAKLRVAEKI